MWQYDLQYSRDIGFGIFEVRVRKACTGHNPQEPKKIQIPACNVPAFKAGKKLKEAVNAKPAKKVRKNNICCDDPALRNQSRVHFMGHDP